MKLQSKDIFHILLNFNRLFFYFFFIKEFINENFKTIRIFSL